MVRKSDYQNNNIGDGFFLVPIEEWICEDDELNGFHLFLTKFDRSRVFLFLTSEGNPVIFRELLLKTLNYRMKDSKHAMEQLLSPNETVVIYRRNSCSMTFATVVPYLLYTF